MSLRAPHKSDPKIVYENPYSHVYSQKVDFGSFSKEYFVTHFGEKAGVVIVRNDEILCIRQYRLFLDRAALEIPGGKVDVGETAEQAAIRECVEETGIRCRRLKPLLNYHQGLEAVYTYVHLFYCDDFEEIPGFTPHQGEVESIEWVPFSRSLEMITEGKIVDSFSILALLSYRVFQDEEQKI